MKFICTLDAITVRVGEQSRTFRRGEAVDLDAQAAPGVIWRAALGAYAETFVPAEAPVPEGPVTPRAAAKKGQE